MYLKDREIIKNALKSLCLSKSITFYQSYITFIQLFYFSYRLCGYNIK